jgi:hypothetical protein
MAVGLVVNVSVPSLHNQKCVSPKYFTIGLHFLFSFKNKLKNEKKYQLLGVAVHT